MVAAALLGPARVVRRVLVNVIARLTMCRNAVIRLLASLVVSMVGLQRAYYRLSLAYAIMNVCIGHRIGVFLVLLPGPPIEAGPGSLVDRTWVRVLVVVRRNVLLVG